MLCCWGGIGCGGGVDVVLDDAWERGGGWEKEEEEA